MKLLTGGSLERADFVETIPFEYTKDLVVLEAEINGRAEKRRFIYDTGAFESKIENSLAVELELPAKATRTNATAQGITQKIEITRLDEVKLGNSSFSDISAGKLKYDAQSASRCIAPHGIIGANLIKLAHWKIDYQDKAIHFSDRVFKAEGSGSHTLEFEKPLLSGTPEIEIVVAGKTVEGILFDVGYNGGLILPARYSDSFTTTAKKVYYDRSTSGIFGTNTDTLISKQLQVSVGGSEMNIPVQFSSIGKALLGNDVLEHFTVTINYDEQEIMLHPRSTVQVDTPYSFIPGMLNDSLWVVNRTTSNSPFALGDTLQSINGYTSGELFSSFCDYFLNINTLLDTDSLSIKQQNGSTLTLDPRS